LEPTLSRLPADDSGGAQGHPVTAMVPPPRPAPAAIAVTLMGVRLDNLTEQGLVDHIVSSAALGAGGWMVNPNVDVLRQIVLDPTLRQLVADADLVVADGMPLLWAARLQGSPLRARVPVSEAVGALCAAAATSNVGVFLLGGPEGVAERAGKVLTDQCPGLVAAHLCPPFGFEDSEAAMAEIDQALASAAPGIVFCAFGFPKQERLMKRFPGTWFIGSGGTFSMVAGDTPKAPVWMSRSGLEWLHRLRLEPRRLFERYIVRDLPFTLRLLGSSALGRFSPPSPTTEPARQRHRPGRRDEEEGK
jgi:N-acetylglucosaminyldiphosphoundecaprenol N-acetyl-beta-D-mannosaminyltransferase